MEETKKFVPEFVLVNDHWLAQLGLPVGRLIDQVSGGMIVLTVMATRDTILGHLDDLVSRGTVDPETATAVQERVARLGMAKDMAALYAAIVGKSDLAIDMQGWGTICCRSRRCVAADVPHACFSLGGTPVSGMFYALGEVFRAVDQYWLKGQVTPQQAAVLLEQMVNAGLATDDAELLAIIGKLPPVRQRAVKAWVQSQSLPRFTSVIYMMLSDPFGEFGRPS